MHARSCLVIAPVLSGILSAQPVIEPWDGEAGTHCVRSVAAAALSGWYAAADIDSNITIFDVRGATVASLGKPSIRASVPDLDWTQLGAHVCGLAWSDSGRSLFIGVCDDSSDTDAILRYDTDLGTISPHVRFELTNTGPTTARTPLAFFRGRLYAGTAQGRVLAFEAGRNTTQVSGPLWTAEAAPGHVLTGLAVDREQGTLLVSSTAGLHTGQILDGSIEFTTIDSSGPIIDVAYSDHYGGEDDAGVYLLREQAGARAIEHAAQPQSGRFRTTVYTDVDDAWFGLASTACGRLLGATAQGARSIRDAGDGRLAFEAWLDDEFSQVLGYVKALVQADGWVLDGSPPVGEPITPPASPDAALWAILMLLAADDLKGDPEARALVRSVMERYAGLSEDGIAPDASADSFFEHWIDPSTGRVYQDWPQEYAVYSTMKLVAGADRARRAYPDDATIQDAAARIVCGIERWSDYFDAERAVFLIADPSGGPLDPGPRNEPFVEGILFAEQAEVFGGTAGVLIYRDWINHDLWPEAEFVQGLPVSGAVEGVFQPAFITLYPLLLTEKFRSDPRWMAHARNKLASFGAWTDDHAPRYYTAFSAGSNPLGGYNADSLSWHPGDVAHFPALMGFAALGRTDPAVAAYNAYRRGARVDLASGSSMLVRRSHEFPEWHSGIGLPDAVYGALGLAELIEPGVIDRLFATGYDPDLCAP